MSRKKGDNEADIEAGSAGKISKLFRGMYMSQKPGSDCIYMVSTADLYVTKLKP